MSEAKTMYDVIRKTDPKRAEQFWFTCKYVPGLKNPTFEELMRCIDRGHFDCVLDSALHLPLDQYEELERHLKRARKERKRRRFQ